MLLQRFTADLLCPPARIIRLAAAFAGQVEVAEYEPWLRRGDRRRPPHALLTEEFDWANRAGPAPDNDPTQRVLAHLTAFFHSNLSPSDI